MCHVWIRYHPVHSVEEHTEKPSGLQCLSESLTFELRFTEDETQHINPFSKYYAEQT